MEATQQVVPDADRSTNPLPPVLAPVLMMAFWTLLGGAAGIKVMQSLWQFLGFDIGEVSIAVPVGGVLGAVAGALLGLISNPRVLVLLMAVFAGSAAGAVAGKVPWGVIGEIGGQLAGSLVGALAWATWVVLERRNESILGAVVFRRGKPRKPGGHMSNKRRISLDEARAVGARLGLNWPEIDLEQFRRGLEVELEHGAHDPETNVTGDDMLQTGKIALAHLKEIGDYYTRLDRLEAEAKAYPEPGAL